MARSSSESMRVILTRPPGRIMRVPDFDSGVCPRCRHVLRGDDCPQCGRREHDDIDVPAAAARRTARDSRLVSASFLVGHAAAAM